MPLDHVAFEQQRLDVARRGHHLDPVGQRHHALQARAERRRLGVGGQSLLERLGFADVENVTLGIEHAVHAGPVRQGRHVAVNQRGAARAVGQGARLRHSRTRPRPDEALLLCRSTHRMFALSLPNWRDPGASSTARQTWGETSSLASKRESGTISSYDAFSVSLHRPGHHAPARHHRPGRRDRSHRVIAHPPSTITAALAGALLLWALAGCATPETDRLLETPTALPPRAEVSGVPFFPQEKYYCGPAALAMVLSWSGLPVTQEEIAAQVYTPGREGTLQSDMVAGARRHGRLAVPVTRLSDLTAELAAGHPVVVFQNLGFGWFPVWHYAVAIGYDLSSGDLVLHSGLDARRAMPLATFERTWARGDHWALVVLPPEELPAAADEAAVLRARAASSRPGGRARPPSPTPPSPSAGPAASRPGSASATPPMPQAISRRRRTPSGRRPSATPTPARRGTISLMFSARRAGAARGHRRRGARGTPRRPQRHHLPRDPARGLRHLRRHALPYRRCSRHRSAELTPNERG